MHISFFKRAAVAITVAIPATACAWGHQGHEVIGALADRMLNAKARDEVHNILGMPLETAARWADCVKDVKLVNGEAKYQPMPRYHAACGVFETPEGIRRMEDYVARNTDNCNRNGDTDACHKQYHYTDVSIQHNEYKPTSIGTSDHDVVHAINAAMAVLRGQPAPAPFDIKDKQEALLLLAHLVGDVHQPLHVGAVYLDANGNPVDPDAMQPFDRKTDTRGGNSLKVGKASNLHSNWDTIAKNVVSTRLPAQMISQARATPVTASPASEWAAAWASDTLHASHAAFDGVTFSSRATDGKWTVIFDNRNSYLRAKNQLQKEQMVKAGARLAQVLNDIWH